jgi:DNA-nicking Smr family endonuclease
MKRPSRRRQLTSEEEALWRVVMKDVTPLLHKGFMEKPAPSVRPQALRPKPVAGPKAIPQNPVKLAPQVINPESAYQLHRGWERKIRRGNISLDDRIDLHGLTREAAFTVLHRFLLHAVRAELRCLLVITGKGGRPGSDAQGILKTEIPRWLNHGPLGGHILSVEAAHPRDGGSGAYYVILRRQRPGVERRGTA